MSFKSVILPARSLVLAAVLTVSAPLMANPQSIEQRLNRLENILGSQVLMDQSQRLELIQQELQTLRGMLESQENQLDLIRQRQRNLYQDMDRRLSDLEITSGSGGASGSGLPAAGMSGGSSPIAPPSASVAGADEVDNELPMTAMVTPGEKSDKSAYSEAFNTLKAGRYQDAINAFKAFQKDYPQSPYRANAQYWLGEAYSVSRDYKTALKEFQAVVSNHPESNKVEGAMLKIGYTYYEMQDWAAARSALNQVVSKYPGTAVARKAEERLQRMQREGH
jgi:tol-pal system protein YbgF